MADNTTISAAVGVGDTIATDDVGGVKYPRSKITLGADGVDGGDVSGSNPMPVSGTGTAGAANSGVVTVQGVASMTPVQVGDNGASLTVDAPAGTPVFVRLSDGAAAITALPVTDNGGSLTVDGTVAATQSGTWTVGISAAQTIAVTNAGTFAVQAAQSGTWNVGTVTTLTGITNVVHVDDNAGSLTVDGTVSVSGTVTVDSELTTADLDTGAGTDTRAVVGLVLAESGGGLLVGSAHPLPVSGTVTANAGTGTFTISGAVTQSGTWNVGTVTTVTGVTTVSTVTSLTQFNGNAIDTNSGVKSAGTLRVVLATDQPQLTNKLLVTPDANSAVNCAQMNGVAVTMGNGASGTGVQRVTVASDSTGVLGATQSGTWTVQPGNTANTTPWLVTDTPATSGGLSIAHVTSAGTNNKTQVKGSAGQVFMVSAQNVSASPRYLKVFDKTSANVTAGTTAADYQFLIPGNTAGAGLVLNIDKGLAHANGITIMVTSGAALNDNTSISANDVTLTIGYK